MCYERIRTIDEIEITLEDISNEGYEYQPYLTSKLDNRNSDFDQDVINEIVLWKVNRYAKLDDETLSLLNKISKNDITIDIHLTKCVLDKLLSTQGIRLAMASTILRFRNPNIYQIIDQRVFRFIYRNSDLTKISQKKDVQIEVYLKYLSDLTIICCKKGIPFSESDRILYILDKKINKGISLKS